MKLTVQTDRSLVRASAPSRRYVLVSVVAPEAERTRARAPINIAFVLDRSGSMGGEKIVLARRAVDHALRLLRDDDHFSLVVYDSEIDVIVESTLATGEARQNALARLAKIDARGNTDLCGGWLRGCEQVAGHLTDGQIGRCLLLTDGLANESITDHAEIVNHARELSRRGVVTSTFGVGADFDERLLQQMADAGSGHFYFIERAVQIPDLLASEVGETLEVVARGVTLTIKTPAGLQADVLNQLATLREGDRAVVQLGDLVSRQELSVVVQVDVAVGHEGVRIGATFSLADGAGQLRVAPVEQIWTFADVAANDGQPRNRVVDEAVGGIYAARARAEALELNRAGKYTEAGQLLKGVVRKIESYAGSSAALRKIIAELLQSAEQASAPMAPLAAKAMYRLSVSMLRSRTVEGKARRDPKV